MFHPSTYSGFDLLFNCSDPIENNAKLTMIRSYGQVPRQLFRQPHGTSQSNQPNINVYHSIAVSFHLFVIAAMTVQSVQPLSNAKPVRKFNPAIKTVDNLQWGCYVGSPSCPDPVVKQQPQQQQQQQQQSHGGGGGGGGESAVSCPSAGVRSFLPLPTGDTYALGPFTAPIVAHSYDKDSFLSKPTGIIGVALILWGQADGVVRVKTRRDQPLRPLFQSDAHDAVLMCATSPDYDHIWVGHRSGLIKVYPFRFDPVRTSLQLADQAAPTVLVGHRGPVTQIQLCTSFAVAVSAGSDGSCILWDLHRIAYVRQLIAGDRTPAVRPVALVAVSRTLGDVACVIHQTSDTSRLELRSINGHLIAVTETSPLVTCVCFSSAPEGTSINVVAGALSSGVIRLWNTWNLNPVRDIVANCGDVGVAGVAPFVNLAFSDDSQYLLAARNDGSVVVWESPHQKRSSRQPAFISLTLQ